MLSIKWKFLYGFPISRKSETRNRQTDGQTDEVQQLMRSLCKVTNRQLSCVDECGQAAVTWTCETALTAAAVKTSEHRHSTMSTVQC